MGAKVCVNTTGLPLTKYVVIGLICVAIVVVASGAAPPIPCCRLRRSFPSASCGELNCAMKSCRPGGMGCHQLLSVLVSDEDEGVGVELLIPERDREGDEEDEAEAVV